MMRLNIRLMLLAWQLFVALHTFTNDICDWFADYFYKEMKKDGASPEILAELRKK